MNEDLILKIIMWGLGICASGFFFLAMWIRKVADKLLLAEIREIKEALVGTFDRPGIITLVYLHTEDIKEIKKRCKEIHPTIPMK